MQESVAATIVSFVPSLGALPRVGALLSCELATVLPTRVSIDGDVCEVLSRMWQLNHL